MTDNYLRMKESVVNMLRNEMGADFEPDPNLVDLVATYYCVLEAETESEIDEPASSTTEQSYSLYLYDALRTLRLHGKI